MNVAVFHTCMSSGKQKVNISLSTEKIMKNPPSLQSKKCSFYIPDKIGKYLQNAGLYVYLIFLEKKYNAKIKRCSLDPILSIFM